MSEATWPPPATPETSWRHLRTIDGDLVRLRSVRLWGKTVGVSDEELARVWCDYCLSLVDVNELARPDNPHVVGLPSIANRPIPMDESAGGEKTPKLPSVMEMEF